jgi:putative peptide zinc metalloprotease protein
VRHRLVLLLLALAAAFGGVPGLAGANDNTDLGLDPNANSAVAINTTNGSSLFKFAFALRHVLNGVVDQQNAAVAYSRCESCQTTAIALEIVLVEGPASNVSPQNIAVAVNESCTLCDTFASAYQFVVGTNGPVRFTPRGLLELIRINWEIRSWGRQGLTNDEMRAKLPALIDRIKQVLATELVPVGRGNPHEGDDNQTDTTEGQANAPPTTATSTTETGTVETTSSLPADTTTDTTQSTTSTPTDTTATTTGSTTTTP